MKANKTLDARGILCPMPIIKTAKMIKEMAVGEILEVIADDEGARIDFPSWCEQTGNKFLEIDESEGAMKFYIEKTK
ncbi:MAG: sulfurtransferase TusA family protein [Desulfobacterales bacterium]|nr:sulfurtransferase TusA family protein [Desulfobacterales bacterium]